MAPETPSPDWSTATAIRQWAQDRGGRVERGELDQRVIPQRLAELATRSQEVQAQENLIAALIAIERGGNSVVLLSHIRVGLASGILRPLPPKARPALGTQPSGEQPA